MSYNPRDRMNALAMTVGCPVCNARPGEWCTNAAVGIPKDSQHVERFASAWGMSAPASVQPRDPLGGRSAHAPPSVGVLQRVPSEPFGQARRRARAAARTRRSIELLRELPWGPGGRR